jgi:hypothetical protein
MTTTDTPAHFEDRLLAEILDRYDELVAPAFADAPVPVPVRRVRRVRRHRTARRAVPALVGAAATAAVAGSHGTRSRASALPAGAHPPTRIAVVHHGHHLAGPHAVLYRLASASAAVSAPSGRYVILSETDTESDEPGQVSKRTSVQDTRDGSTVTYQVPYADSHAPSTLTEGPDSKSTTAYFASLPLDPGALRSQLLTISKRQQAQTEAFFARQAKQEGLNKPGLQSQAQPQISDDDQVYEEADDMLWSPLVSPQLRAALYKVIAGCSGVSVDQDANDPSGRPAIAMTHTTTIDNTAETAVTYEDPQTGAVLAQTWKTGSDTIQAVYQPVTSSDTIPSDPYGN